jgi:acyl carrier protein
MKAELTAFLLAEAKVESEDVALIGRNAAIDSHDLVVLMLAAEDWMTEHGKRVDWNRAPISKTFATVKSLVEYLL